MFGPVGVPGARDDVVVPPSLHADNQRLRAERNARGTWDLGRFSSYLIQKGSFESFLFIYFFIIHQSELCVMC